MLNSADPDQIAPQEQSDLGLRCLLRHFRSNIWGNFNKYLLKLHSSSSVLSAAVSDSENFKFSRLNVIV